MTAEETRKDAWRLVVVVDGRPYAQDKITNYTRSRWLDYARHDQRSVQVWEEADRAAFLLNGWG